MGNFNPRSHKGSDIKWYDGTTLLSISIHAPTRGATAFIIHFLTSYSNFNPRSHKGSDIIVASIPNLKPEFQSTLPQGERRIAIGIIRFDTGDFNPRSHKGSDTGLSATLRSQHYFNPRSHKGSDSARQKWYRRCPRYFNPRSHKGSDFYEIISSPTESHISIHAPTRGATECTLITARSQRYFNPRSHKGSDWIWVQSISVWANISIHAPTRGATTN